MAPKIRNKLWRFYCTERNNLSDGGLGGGKAPLCNVPFIESWQSTGWIEPWIGRVEWQGNGLHPTNPKFDMHLKGSIGRECICQPM